MKQNLLDLRDRLRDGATADIWYDAHSFNDDDAVEKIEQTQDAMQEAANILESLAEQPEDPAVAILREFMNDVESVGVKDTAEDWPDLVVTYNKARMLLAKGETQ